jgi:hypothetical protein
MFSPSRDQVRQFFRDAWSKYRAGTPLVGLEQVALDIVLLHPEYRAVLEAFDAHAQRDYTPDAGESNPFLHMSLHLAIEEQFAIDQPHGIRAAFERIVARLGDRHEASHAALECLGEMMWRAQRDNAPPDGDAYLECLKRRG